MMSKEHREALRTLMKREETVERKRAAIATADAELHDTRAAAREAEDALLEARTRSREVGVLGVDTY